jgi:amidophosphoribosyltransferase
MGYEQAPAELEIFDGFETDKPQDECGVYGVYAPGSPVALLTYGALHEIQHRGQNGAGMAVRFNDGLQIFRGVGMVDNAIPEAVPQSDGQSLIDNATRSPVAIGHTRYSTGGDADASQPFFGSVTTLAVAHNGHIEDIADVAAVYDIDTQGAKSDSQVLTRIIDRRTAVHDSLDAALDEILPELDGAYSLTITDGDRLIGARDPWGFRPLSLGKLPGGGYVLASESVAFASGGAVFERDIEPGEIISIGPDGVASRHINRQEPERSCMFEYIYTARPDSVVEGSRVYTARKYMGRYLAAEHPAAADIIVGVPSSGLAAAGGFAEASGLPMVEGIFKNPYTARSFIMEGEERRTILQRKLRPNVAELAGQRIVLVDDSLIKGNTMEALIGMLRSAGAREVHVRLTAPRYEYGCYMGMDTSDTDKLVARGRTDAEICERIGADSIGFNTPENIERAVNDAREAAAALRPLGALCTACATGDYGTLSSKTFRRMAAARQIVELGMPGVMAKA